MQNVGFLMMWLNFIVLFSLNVPVVKYVSMYFLNTFICFFLDQEVGDFDPDRCLVLSLSKTHYLPKGLVTYKRKSLDIDLRRLAFYCEKDFLFD